MKFRLTENEPSEGKPKPGDRLLHTEHLAAIVAGVFVLATAAAFGWWMFMSSPGREAEPEQVVGEENLDNTDLIDPGFPPTAFPQQSTLPAPALPSPAPPISTPPLLSPPAPSVNAPPAPAPLPATLPAPVPSPLPAPVPAPLPVTPIQSSDPLSDVRGFVANFDGGSCFLAVPVEVAPTRASIEAFASSVSPAEALDRSFLQANGFEAQIGVRLVSPPQCAAVDFARHFAVNHHSAPRVTLDSFGVRSEESLSGSVNLVLGGQVAILLIAENGSVHDFSDRLSHDGSSARFRIDWQGSGQGGMESFFSW